MKIPDQAEPKVVSDLGEFGLIKRIMQIHADKSNSGSRLRVVPNDLLNGIGDDCAVVRIGDGRLLLYTCDALTEDVHFRLDRSDLYLLGRKSAAVNLSDIAGMGGKPTYALVSLALPADLPVSGFDLLQKGIRDEFVQYGALVIGGNITSSPTGLAIHIFLMGEVQEANLLTRSGAKPGDRLCVIGYPGSAGIGLHLLERGLTKGQNHLHYVHAHQSPTARVEIGHELAVSGFVTAMLDTSDGLSSDILHLTGSSNCGATVELVRIPRHIGFEEICTVVGLSVQDALLNGGEDYELLFTVKPGTPNQFLTGLEQKFNLPIREIGTISSESAVNVLLIPDGSRIPLAPKGWDHFG